VPFNTGNEAATMGANPAMNMFILEDPELKAKGAAQLVSARMAEVLCMPYGHRLVCLGQNGIRVTRGSKFSVCLKARAKGTKPKEDSITLVDGDVVAFGAGLKEDYTAMTVTVSVPKKVAALNRKNRKRSKPSASTTVAAAALPSHDTIVPMAASSVPAAAAAAAAAALPSQTLIVPVAANSVPAAAAALPSQALIVPAAASSVFAAADAALPSQAPVVPVEVTSTDSSFEIHRQEHIAFHLKAAAQYKAVTTPRALGAVKGSTNKSLKDLRTPTAHQANQQAHKKAKKSRKAVSQAKLERFITADESWTAKRQKKEATVSTNTGAALATPNPKHKCTHGKKTGKKQKKQQSNRISKAPVYMKRKNDKRQAAVLNVPKKQKTTFQFVHEGVGSYGGGGTHHLGDDGGGGGGSYSPQHKSSHGNKGKQRCNSVSKMVASQQAPVRILNDAQPLDDIEGGEQPTSRKRRR